jgi:hypothetical protein
MPEGLKILTCTKPIIGHQLADSEGISSTCDLLNSAKKWPARKSVKTEAEFADLFQHQKESTFGHPVNSRFIKIE